MRQVSLKPRIPFLSAESHSGIFVVAEFRKAYERDSWWVNGGSGSESVTSMSVERGRSSDRKDQDPKIALQIHSQPSSHRTSTESLPNIQSTPMSASSSTACRSVLLSRSRSPMS